jgi:GrpB-like predicted nucleotidyltransferase (UPF0157 family)
VARHRLDPVELGVGTEQVVGEPGDSCRADAGSACRTGAPPIGQDRIMDRLTDLGLGLDDDTVRLKRVSDSWVDAGRQLADAIAALLADTVAAVEPIGSSSVCGLLAKPIVDLAVGLGPDQQLAPVGDRLGAAGWIYRGDSGSQGGHVFLLSARPGRRVAHVHVVDHDGEQWRNYLSLRDLLRRSPDARSRYEAVKQQLWDDVGDDRDAYTDGKSSVIRSLLAEARASDG